MKRKHFWLLAALCTVNLSVHAQIQCIDDKGRKIFSDMPCSNNGARDVPLSADQRAKLSRNENRSQILNEGSAPRELVQAFERCVRALEAKSKPMYSACMGEDPNIARSEADWKETFRYWKTMVIKKTIIKTGRIDGYMGYMQIEGEQDGQRYSGSVEFRNNKGWVPTLNLISQKR